MSIRIPDELARASKQSAHLAAASAASCEDSADHVRQSRARIARSLDLLTATSDQIDEPTSRVLDCAREDKWGC